MAKLKIKRGYGIPNLEDGEPGFNIDTKKLYIGFDGESHLIGPDENHSNSGGCFQEIAYQDLVLLCQTGTLVPGRQYCIIDYVTKTNLDLLDDDNPLKIYKSARHSFDIIVTADSETDLNENARVRVERGVSMFAWTFEDTTYYTLFYPPLPDDAVYVYEKGEYRLIAFIDLYDPSSNTITFRDVSAERDSENDITVNGQTYYAWGCKNDSAEYVYTTSLTPSVGDMVYILDDSVFPPEMFHSSDWVIDTFDGSTNISVIDANTGKPVCEKSALVDPVPIIVPGNVEHDYFIRNKANVGAWEIKYSIYNDPFRYHWTPAPVYTYETGDGKYCAYRLPSIGDMITFEGVEYEVIDVLPNGDIEVDRGVDTQTWGFLGVKDDFGCKGVIYWMRDECGNEANYDFKNIMYRAYLYSLCHGISGAQGRIPFYYQDVGSVIGIEGDPRINFEFLYTFWIYQNEVIVDSTVVLQGFKGNGSVMENKIACCDTPFDENDNVIKGEKLSFITLYGKYNSGNTFINCDRIACADIKNVKMNEIETAMIGDSSNISLGGGAVNELIFIIGCHNMSCQGLSVRESVIESCNNMVLLGEMQGRYLKQLTDTRLRFLDDPSYNYHICNPFRIWGLSNSNLDGTVCGDTFWGFAGTKNETCNLWFVDHGYAIDDDTMLECWGYGEPT